MLLKKSRAQFALILSPFLLAAGLQAQNVSSVRINTQPPGLKYYVDGQYSATPQTLLWPQGSKHTITTDLNQIGPVPLTQYAFSQIITNLGLLTVYPAVITADPNLTSIEIDFVPQYGVALNYFQCIGDPTGVACASTSPGTILINGTPFVQNGVDYVNAGTVVNVQAIPNPGWIFTGWLKSPGVDTTSQAFIMSFTANTPVTLFPVFQLARAVAVFISSSPPGLQALVDDTPVYSPVTLEWGPNTVHQVAGISPQRDFNGKLWVFDSWSDGGAYAHAYTVPAGYSVLALTANYVTGIPVVFSTNPPGLKLTVDGNQNYEGYGFVWAQGSTHTVSAPLTATDSMGRSYQFQSWSNGGAATQQITPSSDPAADRYVATYQLAGAINIQSSPPGVPMQVDGQACFTPCNVIRSIGATVQVSAPASSLVSDGVRLDFLGWTDGASAARTLTASAKTQTLTASYKLRFQLATSSNPANGVLWHLAPPSPDSFFDALSWVSISVDAKPGFQFLNWAGDIGGSAKTVGLQMTAPHSVRAELNPVPYIAPGGIQNSAALTPENAVAPGSAVAIYGVNLAPTVEVAPNNKLAQTLGGVTVHVGGQVAPIFFVSPGQINVQLPSNLADGHHTLTVHVAGKPDASADCTVSRNAPGLFASVTGANAFAIAAHPDGSAITAGHPARHGEVVTLYGTGLGPYHPQPQDGLAVPAGTPYPLADSAKLIVADLQANPVWAGAAAGRVGVALVQLKIDDTFPHGANASLKVRVNNADSNTVLLPVE